MAQNMTHHSKPAAHAPDTTPTASNALAIGVFEVLLLLLFVGTAGYCAVNAWMTTYATWLSVDLGFFGEPLYGAVISRVILWSLITFLMLVAIQVGFLAFGWVRKAAFWLTVALLSLVAIIMSLFLSFELSQIPERSGQVVLRVRGPVLTEAAFLLAEWTEEQSPHYVRATGGQGEMEIHLYPRLTDSSVREFIDRLEQSGLSAEVLSGKQGPSHEADVSGP